MCALTFAILFYFIFMNLGFVFLFCLCSMDYFSPWCNFEDPCPIVNLTHSVSQSDDASPSAQTQRLFTVVYLLNAASGPMENRL